jgi:hypothetical protein
MTGEFKLRCGDLAAARRNLENSRDRRKELVDREPRNLEQIRNRKDSKQILGEIRSG